MHRDKPMQLFSHGEHALPGAGIAGSCTQTTEKQNKTKQNRKQKNAQHGGHVILFDHRPKMCAPKRDCNIIASARSSSLHTVNARGSVISLAGGFLS